MKTITLFLLSVLLVVPVTAGAAVPVFEARFAGQQTVDGENAVAVTFSDALDPKQNLNTYLSIRTGNGGTVDGAWVLAKDPQVVYFPRVEPDTAYRIEVAKGLASKDGATLLSPVVYEITTRPAEPMIMFASRGFVLASQLTRGLPVDSLNIDKADIDFFRVRPDKVMAFKKGFWSEDYLYYYQSADLKKVADLVYTGRWDLDIKKDLRTRVNIPVTHIRQLQVPGVYFAVLRGAGHYTYGYNTTWFTVSDLGIHARVYDRNIRFLVQSLSTGAPVPGARITGVDAKGKRLFSVTADDSGAAGADGSFEALKLITVTQGPHTTLLPMDVPALDLSEFKAGTVPFRPVELFVYGPRNIYRPGETVDLEGVLRDQDGRMTQGLPIRARVFQPDGRMVREFTLKPGSQNHYRDSFDLPVNALTGKWRVEFTLGKANLAPYPFVVAEFLPERMKLALDGGEKTVLNTAADLSVRLQGDYLYGAPAEGSRADARIRIKPARELFKDRWPGFEFGGSGDLLNTSFTTEDIRLDEQGRANLPVKNQWQKIRSPHWVTANVSLYDAGGRPVVRNWSWQVWPGKTLVGIRNLSATGKDDPTQVPDDSIAEFDVMLADATGERLAAKDLAVTVIREHREYYWEFKNGDWHWGSNSNFYPVDRFSLSMDAGKTARVSFPVEWGGYRLEIKNPATDLTTTFNLWAGWRPEGRGQGVMNRPDRVDLSLDKQAYQGGDLARVTVKAPEGGTGYLFVDAGENLLTLPVSLPPEGKVFEIRVAPEWQRHDIYISALVVRPGEAQTRALPKRAVGLIHLPLDREARKLRLAIGGPAKTEPGRRISVPVILKAADGTVPSHAWVTLAAVDLGVLNLTGFETPSPFDYFFGIREYRTRLQDVYQKLIEAGDGSDARQRFGGDAPVLNRGGDRPSTDVRILSIQKAAVEADGSGRAEFSLDIPQFDGSVRLMAVAHTEEAFGSADREMILASPLVVQADMPRFMATGDEAGVVLEVRNLTPDDQHLVLEPVVTGPATLADTTPVSLDLTASEKAMVRLKVLAGLNPGRLTLDCRIRGLKTRDEQTTGLKERTLERSWFMETRPPYPARTRVWKRGIHPGETFTADPSAIDGLVPGTVAVRAGLGTDPPINLADHVGQLFAYPYGCLEQTVSGLFPHVLLTLEQIRNLGVNTGTREKTAKKIDIGIQRLLEKQKSSGGFGLWQNSDPENAWLSAYAAHFFVLAHDAGFEVPRTAVKKALDRLLVYVRQPGQIPAPGYADRSAYRAAVRAYSAFVLARVQSLTLGDARSVAAYTEKSGKGALAFVQAGVAAGLAGDKILAEKSFDRAIKTARNSKAYIGDYGSDLRDFAMAYALVTAYAPRYRNRAIFALELDRLLAGRKWLSTQERNALVMAGAAREKIPGKSWEAELTVGTQTAAMSGTRPGQAVFVRGTAARGFSVKNTGQADLYVDVLLSGYPNTKPLPENHGVSIVRRFLDIRGNPADISRAVSGDRVIVELAVTAESRMPNALVVDLLPACLELEDPNVSGAFLIDEIRVDKKLIREWQAAYETAHREFRDDRFAAAVDILGRRTVRIFYAARVVSPGKFKVPASLAEDMYRPYIRSIGETVDWMSVTLP